MKFGVPSTDERGCFLLVQPGSQHQTASNLPQLQAGRTLWLCSFHYQNSPGTGPLSNCLPSIGPLSIELGHVSMSSACSTFDPGTFDPARPAAFYLGDEDLADFTDSTWVVQGTELPVCTGTVVQRSTALRAAYRAQRGSAALEASGPIPSSAPGPGGCAAWPSAAGAVARSSTIGRQALRLSTPLIDAGSCCLLLLLGMCMR